MARLNTFLGCMELETGVAFFAWLGIFSKAIIFMVLILVPEDHITIDFIAIGAFDIRECLLTWKISCLYLIILWIVPDVYMIKAVYKRRHEYLIPEMVVIVLGSASYLFMLLLSSQDLLSIMISALLDLYIFMVIFSLYLKYKEERRLGEIPVMPPAYSIDPVHSIYPHIQVSPPYSNKVDFV